MVEEAALLPTQMEVSRQSLAEVHQMLPTDQPLLQCWAEWTGFNSSAASKSHPLPSAWHLLCCSNIL